MKAIKNVEKLPKFLTIAENIPAVMVNCMDLKRGEMVKVAPVSEQKEDMRQYVKVYLKRNGSWSSKRVLGWQHLDVLKKNNIKS